MVNFADTVTQLPTQHRALVCNDWGLEWEHVGCERWYSYPLAPGSGYPKTWPQGDPWQQRHANGTTACQGEDHEHGQGQLQTSCEQMLRDPFPNSCRQPGHPPLVEFDHCSYLGDALGLTLTLTLTLTLNLTLTLTPLLVPRRRVREARAAMDLRCNMEARRVRELPATGVSIPG